MKTIAIIQARLGSTRLPGKILKPLGNKTALAHVIDRVKMCKNLDGIVIAFPYEDASLASEAIKNGVHYYGGSHLDVLDRYYKAAKFYNADRVVRITSDCPFIMPDIVDRLISEGAPFDYASNVHPRTYPKGFDCEVFNFNELERAWLHTNNPYEREHVTPYIISNTKGYNLCDTEDYSNKRITLDTPHDYKDLQNYEPIIGNIYNYIDAKAIMNKLISGEESCIVSELGRI